MTPSANARRDLAAPSAIELAQSMLDGGWKLSGAVVRVIHTARMSDGCGLTVSVSSEAGRVHLDFNAKMRSRPDAYRSAWRAIADAPPPIALLAAVTSANNTASSRDETTIGDLLTTAGWRHVDTDHWAGPTAGIDVYRVSEDLDDKGPLRWRIRRSDLRLEVRASDDTPPTVIAAFALTELT